MSPKVIKVEPLENYQLRLIFSNGEIRRFDVTPYLDKGIFTDLQNIEYFQQVQISFGSVQWPHEQDFSPDTLYLTSQPEETIVNHKSSVKNEPAAAGHLSPELAQIFLEGLPEPIRAALEMRAKTMNYPVWAVIEMAIAGYLDEEALSFADCKPKLD